MLKLLAKGAKRVATGTAQSGMGLQSPHLPAMIVRVGRFLYTVSGVWIAGAWYSGYVNMRTQPGTGPQIILPNRGVIGPPDRPNKTPSFMGNLAAALTGSSQGSTGLDGIAGAVGSAVTAAGGAVGKGSDYYPGQPGRTDQGVDFGTPGPVRAIGDGTVVYAGLWPGWPGTDGIVYSTKYGLVFVMEHFARAINPNTGKPFQNGDSVKQGQVIGQALRGYPWIESGLANRAGTGPLTPYGGSPDGTPMPGGLAFRKLLGYN